ncbi:MAG: hypothetical protein F4Z57_01695 [Gemmatimonadetes bacterium]|nr:hypothetical protein [Gemmatimonadota bacterium]MYC70438.1 hypothetical protein [Gemmatimonadota bacterium]MYI63195.1 hypothetical protein [Gemmatimonadota bacterium]
MTERGFTARSTTPTSMTPAYSSGQVSSRQALGPLSAVAPEGWVAQQPSSSMRVAQYGLPGPAGEATLGIFFFGPGQGGSVEANIERWFGQFKQEDGQPAQGRRWTRQVGDIEITGVDVSGTFAAGMGMGDSEPQPGYRMLGAIAVHRLGTVFFKMTGPAQTVAQWAVSFDEFLGSLQAGSVEP